MQHFDVIVLGIGGVGSTVLDQLTQRGVRAIGIDRFQPPHDRGSTHGHTRVIRQAYFEHSDYVPLLGESYRLWHALEDRVGKQLYHEVGLIEVGPADGVVVPGVLRAAAEHNLAVQSLTPVEIRARWPGLHAPESMAGVFEPGAGYLLVEDCVAAHLAVAEAGGATLMTDTIVRGWTATGREVRVQTDRGEITADRLVITAGAWASQCLLPLPPGEGRGEGILRASPHPNPLPKGEGIISLSIRRKSLFWFATESDAYDVAGGFPVFLFELPQGVFYGFPKLDERGLKFAEHSGGSAVQDPLAVDRSMDANEKQRLVEVLSSWLPGVSSRVNDHAICLYTMSPDEHFIVDRHPEYANIVFAAGLSGHGFKFAPVLGRALAELVLDDATSLPIGFLSLGRFK